MQERSGKQWRTPILCCTILCNYFLFAPQYYPGRTKKPPYMTSNKIWVLLAVSTLHVHQFFKLATPSPLARSLLCQRADALGVDLACLPAWWSFLQRPADRAVPVPDWLMTTGSLVAVECAWVVHYYLIWHQIISTSTENNHEYEKKTDKPSPEVRVLICCARFNRRRVPCDCFCVFICFCLLVT